MLKSLIITLLAFTSAALSEETRTEKCRMTDAYPPPENTTLMEFVIDLDAPADTRWSEPILHFAEPIKSLLSFIFHSKIVDRVRDLIQLHSQEYLERMPEDYGQEMEGIAKLLNVEVAEVLLINMAYELFGLCTSIVAQDSTGHLYHGRNLDFGLWPAMNWTDFQWEMTSRLRDALFKVKFTKGGSVLYQTVAFGSYVGLLTGMKEGAMSITVDSRYDDNYDKYLLKWLTTPDDDDQFLAFMTRMAMEKFDSYDDACNYMEGFSLIAPAYIIIGGVDKNDGAVLTFGPEKTLLDVWQIPDALPTNSTQKWFVLETNYDHWEDPPFFDNRRTPAELCLQIIGEDNISLPKLYNVLHAMPNRNRLTTYTALMDVANGELVAWKQWCKEKDCVPW